MVSHSKTQGLLSTRPSCSHLVTLEVRSPKRSWRAELAHMAGNMLTIWISCSSGPEQMDVTTLFLPRQAFNIFPPLCSALLEELCLGTVASSPPEPWGHRSGQAAWKCLPGCTWMEASRAEPHSEQCWQEPGQALSKDSVLQTERPHRNPDMCY